MSEIIETFSLNGCEKIPDHSVLIWEIELLKYNDINIKNPEIPSTYGATIQTHRYNLGAV